ncbi:MAG: lysoplasmalogenase [Cyclobacteriaceae bacterium]
MRDKKHFSVYVFALGSVLEIFSSIFNRPEWHFFGKPLIMIGLIAHYYFQSTNRSSFFILALVFCWMGDVLLLFEGELFFMLGLAAFLIGHVLYILCYRQFRFADKTKGLLGPQKVRFSFPIILAGTGLVVILYPSLGDLKIPVLIYALVLTLMVLNALFRYGRTNTKSFLFVFIGAALFMVSDSLLAINKFYAPFPSAGSLIMITYCSAQFLIVEGVLFHTKAQSR